MDSKEDGALRRESKRATFESDKATSRDEDGTWLDYGSYERASTNKVVEALDRNRKMRRHFSIIEITEDDLDDTGSTKKPQANTFFSRAKSIELKVIESETELKSKPSLYGMRNGIWGNQSWSLDSKNLHPGVAELLEAAMTGKTNEIKDLLNEQNSSRDSNINFDAVDLVGRTALHFAVYNNHFETANLLINQGVTVDIWDREKKATPLICAAAIGQIELVELLLNNGAKVNNGYDRGNTALLWAAKSRNFDCLKKLLEVGALQNTPAMYCETPLHVAASNGDYEILKLLLENKADIMLRTGDGRNTALHLAAQECNTSCCKLLLDYDAKIDTQNKKGETVLHISALKDLDTVLLLLEHGASVSLKDMEGRTALFYAVEKSSRNSYAEECVAALIRNNADVNCQDNLGLCPLHIAAIKEAKECASILIENNADVSLESKTGTSVLSLMLRKIPDTMNYIKKHLNDSVIVMKDTSDSSCKVKLDFKTITPNGCFQSMYPKNQIKKGKDVEKTSSLIYRKESGLIKSFLSTGQKEILLHPLVEAFLTLKWKKVRRIFYFGFLLKVILVSLFSFFMVYLYAICVDPVEDTVNGNKTDNATGTEYTRRGNCLSIPVWVTIWTLVVCIAVILIAQELTQLFQYFKAYITYIESWVFWVFIISLCVTCEFLPWDGSNFKQKNWQQAFAAVSVFLAWIFILLQLGKFPSSGTLVQMFFKVFYNFVQFFGAFFCFIMAFALAFYILNPVDSKHPYLSFAKTIRMMAGYVSPEDLLFKSKFPIVAQILFAIFAVTIVIVLMNLLVGLAVADIQGMYRDARLLRLSQQAALIYHLESSFLSPFALRCMPKTFASAIKRNILILPYLRNGCYHFKPYDYRDVDLPEYLKLSSLKIVNTSGTDINNDGHLKEFASPVLNDVLGKINEIENKLDNIVKKLDSLSAETK